MTELPFAHRTLNLLVHPHATTSEWRLLEYVGVSPPSRPLGAETANYIVSRLTQFLAAGAVGHRWILTLVESHHSFYGVQTPDITKISIHDASAARFLDITLTSTERDAWIARLANTDL